MGLMNVPSDAAAVKSSLTVGGVIPGKGLEVQLPDGQKTIVSFGTRSSPGKTGGRTDSIDNMFITYPNGDQVRVSNGFNPAGGYDGRSTAIKTENDLTGAEKTNFSEHTGIARDAIMMLKDKGLMEKFNQTQGNTNNLGQLRASAQQFIGRLQTNNHLAPVARGLHHRGP